VLWTIVKDAATYQVKHNQDMEKRFKEADDFGPALRQQQHAHGIQWVLNMMNDFENLQPADSTSILIRSVDPNTRFKWCKKSVRLKRAAAAFMKELKS
jgi:hypothetical protein